jgi:hypothetical protein
MSTPNLTVIRDSEDGLARQRWDFWHDGREHALLVTRYMVGDRPSRRHGFRDRYYSRLDNRHPGRIEHADVPMPDDVVAEVKAAFLAALTVRA